MKSLPARIALATTEAGGRQGPINLRSGYQPHLRVRDGDLLGVEFHLGVERWLNPGESADVELKLLYDVDYSALEPGVSFAILEGPVHEVGNGTIL